MSAPLNADLIIGTDLSLETWTADYDFTIGPSVCTVFLHFPCNSEQVADIWYVNSFHSPLEACWKPDHAIFDLQNSFQNLSLLKFQFFHFVLRQIFSLCIF